MTPRRFARSLSRTWMTFLFAALAVAGLCGCGMNLPEEQQILRDVLRTNFPNWKMITERDLSQEQSARWSAERPGQSPGLTQGDYFGDGSKCYAALLAQTVKNVRRMRVVVMKPVEAGRYETIVLFTESPADTTPRIFTSKAGEYEVFFEGKSLPVPTEGIVYVRGAGQQKLFFWNEDRFQDVELGP